MSGQATGWVLRSGPHPDMLDSSGVKYGARARGLRSVLLTVADAANAQGQHAHPGINNVCIGSLYGRRQASKILAELVAEGWLRVEADGGGAGRATVYSMPRMAQENHALSASPPHEEPRTLSEKPRTMEQEPRSPGVRSNDLSTTTNTNPLSPDGAKPSRAAAFPEPFLLTEPMRAWASENCPALDLRGETEQFCDYHRAKGDRAKDWAASWRTWMRNAKRFAASGRSQPPKRSPDNASENRDAPSGREDWSQYL